MSTVSCLWCLGQVTSPLWAFIFLHYEMKGLGKVLSRALFILKIIHPQSDNSRYCLICVVWGHMGLNDNLADWREKGGTVDLVSEVDNPLG